MPQLHENGLAQQPWLSEFLRLRGFQRNGVNSFSNGRALLRFEGQQLIATPADSGKSWRSDLSEVGPKAICFVLTQILSTPGFLSPEEVAFRAVQQSAAEEALHQVGESIRQNPESPTSQHLRRFVWSLFNGHHALNLWRLKDSLDGERAAAVAQAFSGWMQGFVSEEKLRRGLVDSGEMARWNEVHLSDPDHARLTDAMNAVKDLLNSVPPCAQFTRLTLANELLQQAMDSLRDVRK